MVLHNIVFDKKCNDKQMSNPYQYGIENNTTAIVSLLSCDHFGMYVYVVFAYAFRAFV